MGQRQRIVAVSGFALVLAAVGLSTAMPRSLRQLYLAGAAESLVVMRHNHPFQFRLDWRDHQNQVYIPAGQFTMGAGADKHKFAAHKVYLAAYWIDQFEVTNAMLARCVAAGACQRPAAYDTYYDLPQYADYPAVYVTWWAAQAFCGSEGGRLPTEAEWEKAARGPDRRPYPWGSDPPQVLLLNYDLERNGLTSAFDYLRGISPYGLLNMAGNVREWVSDWYAPDYYAVSPYANPQGPASGTEKSLRGGSYSDNAEEVKVFHRTHHDPNSAGLNRGFRCAFDAGK